MPTQQRRGLRGTQRPGEGPAGNPNMHPFSLPLFGPQRPAPTGNPATPWRLRPTKRCRQIGLHVLFTQGDPQRAFRPSSTAFHHLFANPAGGQPPRQGKGWPIFQGGFQPRLIVLHQTDVGPFSTTFCTRGAFSRPAWAFTPFPANGISSSGARAAANSSPPATSRCPTAPRKTYPAMVSTCKACSPRRHWLPRSVLPSKAWRLRLPNSAPTPAPRPPVPPHPVSVPPAKSSPGWEDADAPTTPTA